VHVVLLIACDGARDRRARKLSFWARLTIGGVFMK
jgi:hypothetical protein